MVGPLILYTAPLGVAGLVSLVLAHHAMRRRAVQGAGYFALLMAAVSVWSATAIAVHMSPTLPGKVFWTNMQYAGITLVPLAWLCFALAYTGDGAVLRFGHFVLLGLHPAAVQIVAWTDPYHGFFRRQVWLDTSGPVATLGTVMGPAFWMHTVYSYMLLLAGAYVLVRAQLRSPRVYRNQGVALFVAVLAPWIANVVTIATAGPLSYTDLTPFAFTISGVALAWGLMRHGLLDLVPIAHGAVLANLSSAVIALDRHDRLVEVNPAAAAIFGLSREDVIGRPLWEVSPRYLDVLLRYRSVDEICEEVTVGEGEQRQVFDLSVAPLYDEREAYVGRLINVRDITEYHRAQETLSGYAEQLRILHEIDQAILAAQSPETIASAALERIPHLMPVERMSVVVYDVEGQPRQLAVRTTGRLDADASIWEKALSGELRDEPDARCANYLPSGAASSPFEQQLRVCGVRAYLVTPLVAHGDVMGLLSFEASRTGVFTASHIDVAHQIATSLVVALENARLYAAAQQELSERKCAEAALVASEAALRQKAEDLIARNAELDAFAHTVAHDLKTPLSLLIGYTSFLEAGGAQDDPDTLALSVRSIGQSARKMGSIIDELLLLASVRKVQDVEPRPLDMHAIVHDVLVRMTDLIDRDGASVDVPDEWPIAMGHAPWIEEVWANYISNALKYGGTPPRIVIGAEALSHTNGHGGPGIIRYWVRDNGDGLSAKEQARLFIPFERLNQARAKGYGLGLSIVQRIMERLGGAAGVESSGIPGAGSTFYFDLPKADL